MWLRCRSLVLQHRDSRCRSTSESQGTPIFDSICQAGICISKPTYYYDTIIRYYDMCHKGKQGVFYSPCDTIMTLLWHYYDTIISKPSYYYTLLSVFEYFIRIISLLSYYYTLLSQLSHLQFLDYYTLLYALTNWYYYTHYLIPIIPIILFRDYYCN